MFWDNSLADQTAVRRRVRRVWSNGAAGFFISLGGVGVIIVVLAIFVFIGYETIPLWTQPSLTEIADLHFSHPDEVLIMGENEYRSLGYAVTGTGELIFFSPSDGTELARHRIPSMTNVTFAAIDPTQKKILAIDSNQFGLILSLPTTYTQVSDLDSRGITTTPFALIEPFTAPIADFSVSGQDDFYAVIAGDKSPPVLVTSRGASLFAGSTPEIVQAKLSWDYSAAVSSVAVDKFGERVVVSTTTGRAFYWDVRDPTNPIMVQSIALSDTEITATKFLLGGQVLIVGDAKGRITTWTWALDSASVNGLSMVRLNEFDGHTGRVTAIASALRNKSFITGDATGEVFLHYQTGGRTLLKSRGSASTRALTISPRGDGILILAADGSISIDSLYNPHPEASLRTLFGKIQYEGYDHPTYTWQSTGGTDDFESKFSLVPLLFGTLKGALYAMVFALPVAILGALYTALFSHPRIRNIVKPIVELMAALPSVVIGFIAALWLAPLLETRFVDAVVIVVLFPLSVLAASLLWRLLPHAAKNGFLSGSELIVLVPAIVLFMILGTYIAPEIEAFLFGGSFRQWLYESANVAYDQRNSIVVGFAMGFAVIPIIFTISEDALSGVPAHLTAGSLALGATRWQTATRVVLPTASPGIFSAAMVGFGRAVGETMIVLMATGNTPVLDFSAFVGMRTLSANIAVEIPEAPYLGTLYRILFFSGLLLFAFTFLVNTVAEIIRQRLRKRYSTI